MQRNIKNKWTLLIFFLLPLTGCTSMTPSTQDPTRAAPKVTWEARQAKIDRMQNWQLNGKVAVQTRRDSGTASVDWVQRGNSYTISLYGPVGSGSMRLSGQPGTVSLVTADGKRYSAKSPEQLLAQRWGFHLPVSNLKYWIRGVPIPGKESITRFDTRNRLTYLSQDGWIVQYQGYMNTQSIDLPSRVAVTSPSLRARLVIYQWNVR